MGNKWIYNNDIFEPETIDYVGFVYLITNTLNGRKYIGKKLFWASKYRQVKGKRKKYKVESDWKEYWSSSNELKEDVKLLGESSFTREILHLCKSKGECNYLEAKEQMIRCVLESNEYYNYWISCKVHQSHLKNLQKIVDMGE